MLAITVAGYTAACGPVSGGVSRIWVFDPADFDFTQAGAKDPYTAVARRAGATSVGGAKMFPITFAEEEAELKFTKTTGIVSNKYEHSVEATLPNLSNDITEFMMVMDEGGVCAGLGLIIELNSGKIFVMGERYVNASAMKRFKVKLTDATGQSGKKWDDLNGANVIFKGNFDRGLLEFTGGAAAIIAFEA
jgi:hypothetical protein